MIILSESYYDITSMWNLKRSYANKIMSKTWTHKQRNQI